MKAGFAEVRSVLPPELCGRLAAYSMEKAEAISNSFQKSIRGKLREEVQAALLACPSLYDACEAAFGTRSLVVENLKVVLAEANAPPQIPHADDYCNRELFAVIHLLDDQAPTECLPYNSTARYPSGVAAQCDACGEWSPLSDEAARRRRHIHGVFTCAEAGRRCGRVQDHPDELAKEAAEAHEEAENSRLTEGFARDVYTAFYELLHRPVAVTRGMRPCGPPRPAGDGLLALPTLVHRGPGNRGNPSDRRILFFSVRPVFAEDPGSVGTYDSSEQLHAGWLLSRTGSLITADEAKLIFGEYRKIGFDLQGFGRIDRVKGSGRKKPNPPGRRRRGKKRSPALARQRTAVAGGAGAEAAEWAAAEAAAEAMEEEEEEEEEEDEEEEEGAEADAEFEAEAAEVTVGGSEGAAKSDASPDGALRVTPPTDVQES